MPGAICVEGAATLFHTCMSNACYTVHTQAATKFFFADIVCTGTWHQVPRVLFLFLPEVFALSATPTAPRLKLFSSAVSHSHICSVCLDSASTVVRGAGIEQAYSVSFLWRQWSIEWRIAITEYGFRGVIASALLFLL